MWLAEHQKAFDKLKTELAKPPSLAHFDPKCETRLKIDASRLKSFGYALLQKNKKTNESLLQLGQGT